MKKLLFILGLFVSSNWAFAGGIVTNTNQSTAWVRMMVRDASTEIDAVFFNPAGLTKLSDGLHLSLDISTIWQTMRIKNSMLDAKYGEYEGKVFAPVFPDFYAAYKTGKFAFSLGFTPIGGGGGAKYEDGVPMIYLSVASTAAQFKDYGVTGYSLNSNFEGSSVYYGLQGGVSYAINDMISVAVGARYVWVKNTYNGEMKDIMFNTAGGNVPASTFMTNIANQLTTATQVPIMMQRLIDNGGGSLTISQAEAGGYIDQAMSQGLKQGLSQLLGLTDAQIAGMSIEQVQAAYAQATPNLQQQAAELTAGAQLMGGQEAETEQTGTGITPIVGVNLSLFEDKLNIGVKYEFQTEIELTNKTPVGKGFTMGFKSDGSPIEMFADGAKIDADIPAMLSLGVGYKFTDKLSAQLGYHNYFDKNLGWAEEVQNGKKVNIIDKNLWELGLGLEYQISDAFLLSAGYLRGQTGVDDTYHNDTRFSLCSNFFGLGGAYKISDMIKLQIAGMYVVYTDKVVNTTSYSQTYGKSNVGFSIGIDFSLNNL